MNIEKYSDWLVASDVDGTILNKHRKLVKKNIDAVADFVKEGGNFTLASGRNPQSLWRYYRKLPLKLPAIVINGAGIYDFAKQEMIYFSPMSESAMEQACKIAKSHPTLDAVVVTKDALYVTGIGVWGVYYVIVDRLTHKRKFNIEKVPKEDWGKVIFCGAPWRVEKLRKKLEGEDTSDFVFYSGSNVSVEIIGEQANKGTAIRKLAEILGIDNEHIAGIGDYYNDTDMLEKVAVPACAGQAPRTIKEISEFVACHCNKGAVADFLNYIVKTKIEKK